jgi:hypothetical protein
MTPRVSPWQALVGAVIVGALMWTAAGALVWLAVA